MQVIYSDLVEKVHNFFFGWLLNWESCHFIVKESIVHGHKISKKGIEVDPTKMDIVTSHLINKLT